MRQSQRGAKGTPLTDMLLPPTLAGAVWHEFVTYVLPHHIPPYSDSVQCAALLVCFASGADAV